MSDTFDKNLLLNLKTQRESEEELQRSRKRRAVEDAEWLTEMRNRYKLAKSATLQENINELKYQGESLSRLKEREDYLKHFLYDAYQKIAEFYANSQDNVNLTETAKRQYWFTCIST